MCHSHRTSLIRQIYLFQDRLPGAESKRLAEYLEYYHANFFGSNDHAVTPGVCEANALDSKALAHEIESTRKQAQNLRKRFELPSQAVFMDIKEIQQLKLDMDEAWKQLPYVEREELKWRWTQGVPVVTTGPSQLDAILPTGDNTQPPPYTMGSPISKYPRP